MFKNERNFDFFGFHFRRIRITASHQSGGRGSTWGIGAAHGEKLPIDTIGTRGIFRIFHGRGWRGMGGRAWRLAVLLAGAGWVEFKAADFSLTAGIWQNLRLWEAGWDINPLNFSLLPLFSSVQKSVPVRKVVCP